MAPAVANVPEPHSYSQHLSSSATCHPIFACVHVADPGSLQKPDTQSLFATQANEALASGHGLFRFAFFRYIPFLNREWIVIADKELAKELLSQDSYGKFQKGGMYKLASPLIGSGILVAAHFYSTND